MWLPKDERHLLQGYWHNFDDINVEETFSEFDLIPLLSNPKAEIGSGDEEATPKTVKSAIANKHRVWKANKLLNERKLIKLQENIRDAKTCTVSLTCEGFDLGSKYSSPWERSGLWFASHKDHWIWLLGSFIGGILGGVITSMICD